MAKPIVIETVIGGREITIYPLERDDFIRLHIRNEADGVAYELQLSSREGIELARGLLEVVSEILMNEGLPQCGVTVETLD